MTKKNTIFNFFVGLVSGISKFTSISAKLSDLGKTLTVDAQFSNYVPSVSSKIGIEFIKPPENWKEIDSI